MKGHLLDLVSHTHELGCIDLIKITGNETTTKIEGLAEDRSIVLKAQFSNPVNEFNGTFGLPNLNNLKTLLNISEYKDDAIISVKRQDRNEEKNVPVGLHFTNKNNDFKNDYRFMVSEVVNDKLKVVDFKGTNWDVEFTPSDNNIGRFKMQAQINPDEVLFHVKTEDGNLMFYFGDPSTHAGNFVFQGDVTGNINGVWNYPIRQVIGILSLVGDKTMKISDKGAMEIVIDSGIASYNYILPAQSK
jgi:hypothetical protein